MKQAIDPGELADDLRDMCHARTKAKPFRFRGATERQSTAALLALQGLEGTPVSSRTAARNEAWFSAVSFVAKMLVTSDKYKGIDDESVTTACIEAFGAAVDAQLEQDAGAAHTEFNDDVLRDMFGRQLASAREKYNGVGRKNGN